MGVIYLSLVWNANTVKGCQPQLLRLVKSIREEKVARVIGEDRRKNFWRLLWEYLNSGQATLYSPGGHEDGIVSRDPIS